VKTVVHHSQPVAATNVGSSALALTGFNTVPFLLLGLGTLALGLLATGASWIRRRTPVNSDAGSRRNR
jgi:hypothetical protein